MSAIATQIGHLFRGSRWNEYRRILETALERGCRLMTVSEWAAAGQERRALKALVLRHDVDSMAGAALKMHELERRLGAKATYYFRWLTADEGIIRTMKADGAEVGLHHETLSFLAEARCYSKGSDITEAVLTEAAGMLAREIDIFERRFGPTASMAAHGAQRHRQLGVRDVAVYERLDAALRRRLRSAYDAELLDSWDDYISDCAPPKCWQYGHSPVEAMDLGRQRISFLSHPEHWDFSLGANLERAWRQIADERLAWPLAAGRRGGGT